MTSGEPIELARTLRERSETEPDQGDVEAVYDLLDAGDVDEQKVAVSGLRTASTLTPGVVADAVDDLDPLLSACRSDDSNVRAGAAALLGTLWRIEPRSTSEAVAAVEPLLSADDAMVRGNAVKTIATIGSVDPEAIAGVVEDVVPILDQPGTPRADAARSIAQVATVDGETAAVAVDDLFDVVETGQDEDADHMPHSLRSEGRTGLQSRVRSLTADSLENLRDVRQLAGHALVEIAADDPGAVAPRVDDLAALLDDPDPQVQSVAVDALVALAGADPEGVRAHADAVADLLVDTDVDFLETSAVQALAAASSGDPADVPVRIRESPEQLRVLLEHEHAPTRGAAAALLAVLADEEPSVVEPAAAVLEDLCEDDAEYVRAAAADALDAVE